MGAWAHGSMGERGTGILSQGFPVARLTSCSCSKKPESFTAEDAENAEAGGRKAEAFTAENAEGDTQTRFSHKGRRAAPF
jgi:hypothetical protein